MALAGLIATGAALAVLLSACTGSSSDGTRSTSTSRATTTQTTASPCPSPLPPPDMALPTDVDLNLGGTVPSEAAFTPDEQAEVNAAIAREPALADFVREQRAVLTIVDPWTDGAGHPLGIEATFRFIRPTDLPTSYGEPVDDASAGDAPGLPTLVPVDDPQSFEDRVVMDVFISGIGTDARVHHLVPADAAGPFCVADAPR